MGNSITIQNYRLKDATFDNVPQFTLNGMYKKCKILKIYDGDTLWIAIILNKKLYKIKVRMLGYDSPELKPLLSIPDRESIILAAKSAKLYLENLILNKIVNIQFFDYDKYGRPLCKIYINTSNNCIFFSKKKLCVNELMINNGHGYVYNGGKKR